MHSFKPTLTIRRHAPGWDGTFAGMLNAMAGVLDDGPVPASITYWNEDTRKSESATGTWDRFNSRGLVAIVFTTESGDTLTLDEGYLQALSI